MTEMTEKFIESVKDFCSNHICDTCPCECLHEEYHLPMCIFQYAPDKWLNELTKKNLFQEFKSTLATLETVCSEYDDTAEYCWDCKYFDDDFEGCKLMEFMDEFIKHTTITLIDVLKLQGKWTED